MTQLSYILLAVDNPAASAETYSRILDAQPVENSPTFVLYVLPSGLKLGLWIKTGVEPAPKAPGGVEISFSEPDDDAVRATCAKWRALGLDIVQEPTQMDFGFPFVAADRDGHRLRVFALSADPS